MTELSLNQLLIEFDVVALDSLIVGSEVFINGVTYGVGDLVYGAD